MNSLKSRNVSFYPNQATKKTLFPTSDEVIIPCFLPLVHPVFLMAVTVVAGSDNSCRRESPDEPGDEACPALQHRAICWEMRPPIR